MKSIPSLAEMFKLLPKIKGVPDDLLEKIEKRHEKYCVLNEEFSKQRYEYLIQKIKYDTLLDLSTSVSDQDLTPSLVVSKDDWSVKIHQGLLNGKKNVTLDKDIIEDLKSAMLERLQETSSNLMNHWSGHGSNMMDKFNSKQLPILIQSDLESLSDLGEVDVVDMKQLKHESRRKDLLQNHSKVTKELVTNHALGHTATLDKLQIDYLSAKKR